MMASKRAAAFGQPDLKRELKRAAGTIHQFRNQKLAAMAIEPPQRLAHHIQRHDAGDDGMLFTKPRRKCREQSLRRHVQFVAQVFRGLFEFGEIIAVGLDQVADALDRIGLKPGALIAVGHLRGDQGLAAAGFGIGRVKPLQRMGDARTQFGEIAQFLFGQVDLPEQRIGKDLVQLGEEPVLVGGGEIPQIEVIGFRQPQQDLRRHRALVALDQVDVGGRDAEPFGDLGLRQPQLLADAPEAGPDKQLFPGIAGHGCLSRPSRHSGAMRSIEPGI